MKNFLISTLFAAGLSDLDIDQNELEKLKSTNNPLFNQIDNNLNLFLAGHSSHKSHGSHASHGSHRSSSSGGSGGGTSGNTIMRDNKSRVPEVIPPPKIPDDKSSPNKLVEKVQSKLKLLGMYTGALDGIIGDQTIVAIARYEVANGMPISGKVTTELLNKLGIKY